MSRMHALRNGLNKVGFKKIAFDPHFIAALVFGPIVWGLLSFWFAPLNTSKPLQAVVAVCVIYPVLEELAFRGFLQTWLIEKPVFKKSVLGGVSNANLLTSIIFAAFHLFNQEPLWAMSVFFPSLVFGYFRDRYELVWPSIVLHCWYNTGFFLLLT